MAVSNRAQIIAGRLSLSGYTKTDLNLTRNHDLENQSGAMRRMPDANREVTDIPASGVSYLNPK